ncbi:MAG TPA: acetylxylan esterase [bacterium]|uniref:Acetyl xylan esterase (AXE1) n=1 Tax=candidate division TA06 bacterium ADurb.Bin417 TaxID=1852828 RepID=A0A1V5MDI0_UNCT6|nr:MAG: Acetyl xylan esterase (AXE1) [candidate division TA06 bacterium ADurb.Bin417]HNQ35257.1 acetylxylan esterase [bacterium]HNS48280.1 acetylxylan esterase [bacterium]
MKRRLPTGSSDGQPGPSRIPWDIKNLSAAPEFEAAPEHDDGEVKAIFYQGLPWRGKGTGVFAYYAIPRAGGKSKIPAMVLVHGGGGSAFVPWVRLWAGRGYAAIAMDTCGCVSGGGYQNHPRHPRGGPPGWGGFDQVDQPIEDQWTCHAVADVILAHSLIRSFPEVDPNKTGLTGISWGGYLTCIAAGVDPRFKFAAPVYGCGFLGDNSIWLDDFRRMGTEKSGRWLRLWDPSVYLPLVKTPLLWVTGPTDAAYPLDSLQKSYRLPPSPRTLCVRVGMTHGHGGPGENPEEIRTRAEARLKGGIDLARITAAGREGRRAFVSFEGRVPVVKAELNYTTDAGPWRERKWQTIPAELDAAAGRAEGPLPKGATVYYFNLADERRLVVSSEHEEILTFNGTANNQTTALFT